MPNFDDSGALHPVDFINRLEQLVKNYNISDGDLTFWCYSLFTGKAKSWADGLLFSFKKFENLKASFLDHFWSFNTQQKRKRHLEEKGKFVNRDDKKLGYVNYFLQQVAFSRHLQPSYSEPELVGIILRHYPFAISSALIGTSTIHEALNKLRLAEQSIPETQFSREFRTQSDKNDTSNINKNNYRKVNQINNPDLAMIDDDPLSEN